MKALKEATLFSLVIGLVGFIAYWNWVTAPAEDDYRKPLSELEKSSSESEQIIELWLRDSQELNGAIRKGASSARTKDLLIIFGLQEIGGSQIVKRVFQYDNRKYLVGWLSHAADGSLKEKSVFKYNDQSYLIEWCSYDVADKPVRKILFQYDNSGYLIECEVIVYEREQ